MSAREPAVAGMFYPGRAAELTQTVNTLLAQCDETPANAPKAIIAPHAGYVYSGPIAASAYATLANARDTISNVVLLGPSHRVYFHGLAVSSASEFLTPLGAIPVNHDAIATILALPQVQTLDDAHAVEHSLEVHLPFLQRVLRTFTLVPIVVGEARAESVAEVLEKLWGGAETLIVISSDLSHYHDYATAQQMDRSTSTAIERLAPKAIDNEHACGRYPVNGLLLAAKQHGLRPKTVDLRNSGDTAGPRDQVVGYGAYIFEAHA